MACAAAASARACTRKVDGKRFALKSVLKSEVERIKKRHPNVHNEINMEKRALGKLDHPFIIKLSATFQDAYTLYFLVEFCEVRAVSQTPRALPAARCSVRASHAAKRGILAPCSRAASCGTTL